MAGTENPVISGLRQPVLDVLHGNGAYKFRKQGENLDLSDEKPVYSGCFKAGNGWQKILFGKTYETRYFCLEALNSHGNDDFASIAELEIQGSDGKPLSRQHWKIVYADSEEADAANNIASNVFDLQESTIWYTSYSINSDKPNGEHSRFDVNSSLNQLRNSAFFIFSKNIALNITKLRIFARNFRKLN